MSPVPMVYVNEDGDIWIERKSAPWPDIRHEAAEMARQMGDFNSVVRYVGLEQGVRVSDEEEAPHDVEDEACVEGDGCRTIEAFHFRVADRGDAQPRPQAPDLRMQDHTLWNGL